VLSHRSATLIHHDSPAPVHVPPNGDGCPSAACHPCPPRRPPRRRPVARDAHAGELLASSRLCAISTPKGVTVVRLHGIGPVAVREECIKSATPERPDATLCLVVILAGILARHGMRLAILVHVCTVNEDVMLQTQMTPPVIILVRRAEATRRRQRAGRSMVPNPAGRPTLTHRPRSRCQPPSPPPPLPEPPSVADLLGGIGDLSRSAGVPASGN